jgi:hypothetical protein
MATLILFGVVVAALFVVGVVVPANHDIKQFR